MTDVTDILWNLYEGFTSKEDVKPDRYLYLLKKNDFNNATGRVISRMQFKFLESEELHTSIEAFEALIQGTPNFKNHVWIEGGRIDLFSLTEEVLYEYSKVKTVKEFIEKYESSRVSYYTPSNDHVYLFNHFIFVDTRKDGYYFGKNEGKKLEEYRNYKYDNED